MNNWNLSMNSYKHTVPMFLLSVLLLGVPYACRAQNTTEGTVPPLVAAVPDFFSWTVTIESTTNLHEAATAPSSGPGEKAGTIHPAGIVKVVTTKTKGIKHDVIYYSNGSSFEVWYYQNLIITKSMNGDITIDKNGKGDATPHIPDLSASSGFVGVDWIIAPNFQGRKKLNNGREVYIYSGPATLCLPSTSNPSNFEAKANPGPQQKAEIAMEAIIDVETRLPLIVKKGAESLIYSYQPPPTQMLELPAGIQKQMSAINGRESFIEQLRNISNH
jgi:hypothetical protein